jgi:hypothetical protein
MIVLLAVCLLAVLPASGQVQAGSLSGTVVDEQGGVLPGVTVSLTGSDLSLVFTTDTTGRYRFINLPPGAYTLTFELSGFARFVHQRIEVKAGANVDLKVVMRVTSIEETVTVCGETPIIDTKNTGTSTNFTQAELSSVPTSRDPWALLRTVPGVMVDRVNIAGNNTGQQRKAA